MSCLQNFSTKEIWNNHRERCLLSNDTQVVKYETGTIKYKYFNKQKLIPFKIYAYTEYLLKRINNNKDKVRDHYYITGEYKGAAHDQCKKVPRKIPIIFHNLGYDGHIIFKELNNFDNIDIQVIPKTSERFMSIIINKNIVFLDSLQFCKESLDKLASNLNNEDFKHLMSEFSPNKLEILKIKDAYPYEWVDSYEKFNYTELPPKECFYSPIKDGKRDFINVWNIFNFNTFKDYHNHYLKKDVLLLADVFEKFIHTCLNYDGLDPCHYFSFPGLSWDAMLKMTKVELKKISNVDMHLFIEKGMRGGTSYASKRYSKANNEYCPDYDKTKPEKYIHYLDMNNLYRKAMTEYLLYGGFKWVKVNNKTINRILNKSDNSLHGCFLEVDLDYPEYLHKNYVDYVDFSWRFSDGTRKN